MVCYCIFCSGELLLAVNCNCYKIQGRSYIQLFLIISSFLFLNFLLSSVDIICERIKGRLTISSQGGNGHKGQNGIDGRSGSPAIDVSYVCLIKFFFSCSSS